MIHRTEYKTREEWLALRTSMEDRLGGSDIGVAAGHSQYRSPYNLFCEKVGIIEPQDLSEKEAIKQAAVDRGVPKRDVYNEVIDM